jgi:hypothetical protein
VCVCVHAYVRTCRCDIYLDTCTHIHTLAEKKAHTAGSRMHTYRHINILVKYLAQQTLEFIHTHIPRPMRKHG